MSYTVVDTVVDHGATWGVVVDIAVATVDRLVHRIRLVLR